MDVSVVIVSFNAASYLRQCLDSVFRFTKDTSFEVIVVDNASADDSVAVAKGFGNKVTLIANKDNRGFGVGVNIGLKKSAGKYVLILNPDILFLEDSIGKMLAWMEEHGDVGLAGCTFLDNDQKMLPNGGYFPTLTRLFFWTFFLDDLPMIGSLVKPYHPHLPYLPYSSDFFPDWVTGSFMFLHREVVFDSQTDFSGRQILSESEKANAGMLDENIFMYGEEVEWQYRIRLAGWKVGYTPVTKVIHYERKSSGGSPRNAILGEFRGLKYIYGKHFPGWKQIILGSLLDVAAFNRVVLWLVRRNREMTRIYLEALAL